MNQQEALKGETLLKLDIRKLDEQIQNLMFERDQVLSDNKKLNDNLNERLSKINNDQVQTPDILESSAEKMQDKFANTEEKPSSPK